MSDCSKRHAKGCVHRIEAGLAQTEWPEWKPGEPERSLAGRITYGIGYGIGIVIVLIVVALILMLALTGAVLIVEDIVLPALRGA